MSRVVVESEQTRVVVFPPARNRTVVSRTGATGAPGPAGGPPGPPGRDSTVAGPPGDPCSASSVSISGGNRITMTCGGIDTTFDVLDGSHSTVQGPPGPPGQSITGPPGESIAGPPGPPGQSVVGPAGRDGLDGTPSNVAGPPGQPCTLTRSSIDGGNRLTFRCGTTDTIVDVLDGTGTADPQPTGATVSVTTGVVDRNDLTGTISRTRSFDVYKNWVTPVEWAAANSGNQHLAIDYPSNIDITTIRLASPQINELASWTPRTISGMKRLTLGPVRVRVALSREIILEDAA